MAREDRTTETIDYLVIELQRNIGTLTREEVVATLQYLESLVCGSLTPGTHDQSSRMMHPSDVRALAAIALDRGDEFLALVSPSACSTADGEAMNLQRARPVRSAASTSCLWDDVLNEEECVD